VQATFEGIAVLALALLPGAIYTWSFERIAGRWGIGLSDRLYRFVGLSALYQAAIAPITWKVWLKYLRHGAQSADKLPWWLWPLLLVYLAVPAVAGSVMASQLKNKPPTAWDAVFSGTFSGYVLARLKSGRWIGGEYSEGSHVAGYPEPADIYLAQACVVDQQEGDFVRDAEGKPVADSTYGLLVRWSDLEYLEVSD
jgi:Family of unknown function (DUF6338)